jgi:hypothetical protein
MKRSAISIVAPAAIGLSAASCSQVYKIELSGQIKEYGTEKRMPNVEFRLQFANQKLNETAPGFPAKTNPEGRFRVVVATTEDEWKAGHHKRWKLIFYRGRAADAIGFSPGAKPKTTTPKPVVVVTYLKPTLDDD